MMHACTTPSCSIRPNRRLQCLLLLQRFDATQSPPVLSRELASGGLAAAGARVVIPGCGRGYDVESVS